MEDQEKEKLIEAAKKKIEEGASKEEVLEYIEYLEIMNILEKRDSDAFKACSADKYSD